jgi:hypothetical protein
LFTDGFSVETLPEDRGRVLVGVFGCGVVPDPLGALGALGAGAAHDSETDATGSFIGNANDESGVPGGTLTVNDS